MFFVCLVKLSFETAGRRKFQCSICGEQNRSKTELLGHIRQVHYKNAFFYCPFCPYDAPTKNAAWNQVNRAHRKFAREQRFKRRDLRTGRPTSLPGKPVPLASLSSSDPLGLDNIPDLTSLVTFQKVATETNSEAHKPPSVGRPALDTPVPLKPNSPNEALASPFTFDWEGDFQIDLMADPDKIPDRQPAQDVRAAPTTNDAFSRPEDVRAAPTANDAFSRPEDVRAAPTTNYAFPSLNDVRAVPSQTTRSPSSMTSAPPNLLPMPAQITSAPTPWRTLTSVPLRRQMTFTRSRGRL